MLFLTQITRNHPINDVNHSATWSETRRCHEHELGNNSKVVVRQVSVSVSDEQGMYCGEMITT